MKQNSRISVCAALIAIFVVAMSGCAWSGEDEDFADKAVSLGYVAVAVNGYIRYGNPPESLSGEALVIAATRANPTPLLALNDFYVVARREGHLSSVLMCNKERTRAIAEDAGCTAARLDARLWREPPNALCAFQLNLIAVCGAQK